ncbi:FFLEELY motif protein, partial [Acinetobacter baumannii]|uniref:FFLEELY motif protein n=1 Tax=Acinetobacter baumannii TaxID=470 RepID=UPI0038B63416
MSKLAAFDELLQQYKTFNYHDNPVLAQRLQDVQTWLKERMKETHHDFFNLPEHKLMAQYFLNRLYGGPEFDALAAQIERLLKYAHKASVHDKFHRTLILSGFCLLKIAKISL